DPDAGALPPPPARRGAAAGPRRHPDVHPGPPGGQAAQPRLPRDVLHRRRVPGPRRELPLRRRGAAGRRRAPRRRLAALRGGATPSCPCRFPEGTAPSHSATCTSNPPTRLLARMLGDKLGVEVGDGRPKFTADSAEVDRFRRAWKDLPRLWVVVAREAGDFTR